MKNWRSSLVLALFCLTLLAGSPARADFIPIPQPTAAYTSGTNLWISPAPQGTSVSSVGAVSFSTQVTVGQVPDSWATWNSPPAVETSTPQVLKTDVYSTITLSFPSSLMAGVEVEPDNFAVEETTASFYDGAVLVGTIDQSPNGSAGALLFAASTTTSPFTSIVITNLTGDDMALGRPRTSGGTVPEPTTMLLLACGLLSVGFKKFRRS